MIVTKLVKNLLVLIVVCAKITQINGTRANNEEDPNSPDAHIIYDQRQSGKYNIHVVIKDVAIIEMDQNELSNQNYNDEEYYYDENDLTVKPLSIKPTTASVKPLQTTEYNKTIMPLTTTSTKVQIKSTTLKPSQQMPDSTPAANKTTSREEFDNNDNENFMTFLTKSRPAVEIKSRSKVEPIYAIEEPVIKPMHHSLHDFGYGTPTHTPSKNIKVFQNSRVFKPKMHRSSHKMPQIERCQTYQYKDARGNCRGKRSSSGSILKHLFRMLVTLPFTQDEHQTDE